MFEARVTDSQLLRKILEAIKDLVQNANFDCSGEGMSLQALDQAHVALVSVRLHEQAFELYRCDRSLSLGVNLPNLAKIFRWAGPEDSVKITADDEGGTDTVEFQFENAGGDRVSEFTLKLMDIDADHFGIPEDEEYHAVIAMPSTEFRRIFADLTVIGNFVLIDVSKRSAVFSADGDIGTASLQIQQSDPDDEDDNGISITVTEPTKMRFSAHYLTIFAKAAPISSKVVIGLKKDMPIAVEFNLPNENGYVRFFLSPNAEEQSEED